MKENIWQVLINKEKSRAMVAETRLKDVLEQYQRIAEKKQYLDDILSEYSQRLSPNNIITGQDSILGVSAYMLQLFRIKENLQTEEEGLSVIISEHRQILAKHRHEIQKYSKLKSVAVNSRLTAELELECRYQDESNVVRYNIERRYGR